MRIFKILKKEITIKKVKNNKVHYSLFTISKTSERKSKRIVLENNIKVFKELNQEYLNCKLKLNDIFDQNAEGIKIDSKCKQYEEGEKKSKYLLNLERSRTTESKVRLLKIK